jgi:hypothetical protein
MYELPVLDGDIYALVKICLLFLILCLLMAITAAPVY